ncbi:hypothetical protein TorRG33x02_165940 [Trema orientale]|uniref:Uncharacterized protein n=1 Tax=Trema orientale TaxID=63057 RepID=A0A2P5EPW6_TREOI|nr:hypothetical protein TorRG33x02_165940 [Trema orientale]
MKNRNIKLLSNIYSKPTKDPVRYDESNPRTVTSTKFTRNQHLSQNWLCLLIQGINDIHKPVTGSRVVLLKAVRDGPEKKTRVFREPGFDIGVPDKTIVDVIGVEKGDVEACQGKKLGELEHGVDMSLSCQGKDENSRMSYLWSSMFHLYCFLRGNTILELGAILDLYYSNIVDVCEHMDSRNSNSEKGQP